MDSRSSWISFIVIAAAFAIVIPPACGAADLIYDSDGHVLQQGVEYYVLPATKAKGHTGGITLRMRNNSCPMYVAQEKSRTSQGLPVMFTPLKSVDTFQDGIPVHITSVGETVCVQSTTWSVKASFIEAVSASGSLFSIGKKGDNDYVLYRYLGPVSWCKKCGVGPASQFFLQELGIFVDEEENRWLALPSHASEPLHVHFKKAQE